MVQAARMYAMDHGSEIGKAMRKAFDDAGVAANSEGGHASFHSLRATFISLMDDAGAPVKVTDLITGHASAGTMHDRYSQPDVEIARKWILKAIPPLDRETKGRGTP
jgi:integrase